MSMSARPARLRFDSIERVNDVQNGHYDVKVKLSFEDKAFYGQSRGYDNRSNELEIAAMATLQAVEEFVQRRFECKLLEVDRVNALDRELIVLLVNVHFDERDIQIFGSCQTTNNILDATARAALDATNRYIELALV
jgi:hypothetical protein